MGDVSTPVPQGVKLKVDGQAPIRRRSLPATSPGRRFGADPSRNGGQRRPGKPRLGEHVSRGQQLPAGFIRVHAAEYGGFGLVAQGSTGSHDIRGREDDGEVSEGFAFRVATGARVELREDAALRFGLANTKG